MAASLSEKLHFWARNASNESALLQTAFRLRLLDVLPVSGTTGTDLDALSAETGARSRGLRSILEPMVAMGVAEMDDVGRFNLSAPVARAVRDPQFRAELEAELGWWGPTGRLTDAVRTGQPVSWDGRSHDVLGHLEARLCNAPNGSEEDAFLDRFARSYLRHAALLTAGETGLLSALGAGPASGQALATRLELDEAALSTLLRVLVGMGLVQALGDQYAFTPEASDLLRGDSLAYFVKTLPVSALYWEPLRRLDEAVLHGRFLLDLKDPAVAATFYSENSSQITRVFATHLQLSRRAAATVQQVRSLAGASVLDIGTGSGVWGAAFAMADPTVSVSYFDQPAVLELVKKNLVQLKLDDNARLRPGNLFADDFGTAAFDVIILPQVLNVMLPETLPDMFARVARALRPDGLLVIAEYVLNDRRDGPLDHLYFAFRRYMTNEGDLLSLREYSELLRAVGLTEVRLYPLPTQEMIIAARPGAVLPENLAPPPPRRGGRTAP